MARQFDVSLKHLVEHYPGDWVRLIGVADSGAAEVVDADLATVAAEADKVIRLAQSDPWMLHLEFQSGYDLYLPDRLHWYNALLYHRHRLPVLSTVFLLRRSADGPAITGMLQRELPSSRRYLEFFYDVVRVWDLPLEAILAGGIGTLPLAPLARDAKDHLDDVVRKIDRRFENEIERAEAASLGPPRMF